MRLSLEWGVVMINKIGICDDNVDYLIELEFLIEDILKEIHKPYEIETFSSSIKLKNYLLEDNHIDILILDIEMPEISGIEIGEFILGRGLEIIIIYLTNHAEYSLRAYDTFPFHYLIKPVTKSKLKEIVLLATKKKENEKEDPKYQLLLKFNHSYFKIELENIMYIVKQGNMCIFKGKKNKYRSYITLNEVYKEINNTGYKGFIRSHQSYLINLKWVWEFKNSSFILSNGEDIPISRRYKNHCEKKFKKYFWDKT